MDNHTISIPMPTGTVDQETHICLEGDGPDSEERTVSTATFKWLSDNKAPQPVIITNSSVSTTTSRSPELPTNFDIITWLEPVSVGTFQTIIGNGNRQVAPGTYWHRVGGYSISCSGTVYDPPNCTSLFISSTLNYR